jgi:hypothetical protein
MPRCRDKVKAEQVKSLLAYVCTFAPGQAAKKKEPSDFEEKLRSFHQELEELKRQKDELMKKSKQP